MANFHLEQLMQGTIKQLKTEAGYFSTLTSHNPEKGRLNETHLVNLLRRYLPPKFGVGTGFIVSGGNHVQESSQCDIIIYDPLNNAPFYSSDAWQIYPIEMVYGVIEVKTKINKNEIRDALNKCAKLRSMCGNNLNHNKAYIRQGSVQEGKPAEYLRYTSCLPPRFFIFGYNSPNKKTTLENNIKELTKEVSNSHVHGFCTLNRNSAIYTYHIPYRKPEARVAPLRDNGLSHFLMEMPKKLNSMLPVLDLLRSDADANGNPVTKVFPYRFEHFDLVDLDHYKNFQLDTDL